MKREVTVEGFVARRNPADTPKKRSERKEKKGETVGLNGWKDCVEYVKKEAAANVDHFKEARHKAKETLSNVKSKHHVADTQGLGGLQEANLTPDLIETIVEDFGN